MIRNFIGILVAFLALFSLSSCKTTHFFGSNQSSDAAHTKTPQNTKPSVPADLALQGDPATIWKHLQKTPVAKLQSTLNKTSDPTEKGWLTLAMTYQNYHQNTKSLVDQLQHWRKENPNHPALSLIPNDAILSQLSQNPYPKHIALLLPLKGQFSAQGQMVRDGFLSAYYETLSKNPGQTVTFYDTSRTSNIYSLYQKAISNGSDMIVGPLTKENVSELSQQNRYPVTTIALNYTDQTLPKNFFEFGLSPKDEAIQLAIKAREMGYANAIIIAPKDDWSQRIAKPLLTEWQKSGGKIVDSYYYPSRAKFAEDIPTLLHVDSKNISKTKIAEARRKDFDAIFLIAQPDDGREIVPLLKYYEASNIPIFSTSVIYSGIPSPEKDHHLNGIIFCDIPWVLHKNAKGLSNRLYAVGRDAALLSNELPRLSQLPNFPINAATGTLTLSSSQHIYRQVPWTEMRNGHPE